ncbi:MAG: CHAD domain-containing protein [Leptolyngbyaceae cyanobacterium RM1_406_9]|nr:CHAD domain-containing protein [Leptolyngbyaceae cyanobacterium RM1_406_9]
MNNPISTAGDYAHTLISKHYLHMIQQEQGVLVDNDPEYLHDMRVESRRLSTALRVFGGIVTLPKAAREPRVLALTKALGQLRDLDVQITAIKTDYSHRLNSSQQKLVNKAVMALEKRRTQAFTEVKSRLTGSSYQKLKTAYEDWLQNPQYTSLANLPLQLLIPELLSPLLSVLLLHPAWLISVNEASAESKQVLHHLRKTCKYVRYQAEFFTCYYSQAFQDWVDELKELQNDLGKVQDACVLLQLLTDELPDRAELPELQQLIQTDQINLMKNWETLRNKYLDADFRHHLHQMILIPSIPTLCS